jgi:hypothetical protein
MIARQATQRSAPAVPLSEDEERHIWATTADVAARLLAGERCGCGRPECPQLRHARHDADAFTEELAATLDEADVILARPVQPTTPLTGSSFLAAREVLIAAVQDHLDGHGADEAWALTLGEKIEMATTILDHLAAAGWMLHRPGRADPSGAAHTGAGQAAIVAAAYPVGPQPPLPLGPTLATRVAAGPKT